MRRCFVGALALGVITAVPASADVPVSLRGSPDAMIRQHTVALAAGYPFARTPGELAALEEDGELVRLYGNDDYGFREGVHSMVGRPELGVFVERLARDYRAACGEKLIVTSMTRPLSRQPRNAHRLSVHPAGIAVDLRVSRNAACRSWLEDTFLTMEAEGLLDAIRERSPPHYHVALFPEAYMARVQPLIEAERTVERADVLAERMDIQMAGSVGGEADGDRGLLWRVLVIVPGAFLAVFLVGRRTRSPSRSPF